jgi:hypothetical protein
MWRDRASKIARRSSCASDHHASDLRIGISAARVHAARPSGGLAATRASFSARST